MADRTMKFDVRVSQNTHSIDPVIGLEVRLLSMHGNDTRQGLCGFRRIYILPLPQACATNSNWYEYSHLCRLAFSQNVGICDALARSARVSTLWLIHDLREFVVRGTLELKRHLESLEARRRYDRGWIVGGHTLPIRDEIVRLGGLWLQKHKAWTMPDRDSWLYALSLLPGDF